MVDCSLKLIERLNLKDYSRFDWRLDSHGNPKLLEVNPNPAWCWDGHLAKAASLANIDYTDMIRKVIKSTEQRILKSKRKIHS